MKNQKGFTLIELLVVIAIIGILAAIEIPQFAEYKTRAFDSRAQTDLRNGLTAEEAYFVDREEYAACTNDTCATSLPGFVLSEGVQLQYTIGGTGNSKFAGASCHSQGEKVFEWSSDLNVLGIQSTGGCSGVPTPPAVS